MVWVRLAIRELAVNRGFSLFFVLNLALGLAGFIAVQSFGRSVDRHLADNLKALLTADLVLSASTPLTGPETELVNRVLGPGVEKSRMVSFYTMLRPRGKTARLVKVMAVDASYPLYGSFSLEKGGQAKDLQTGPGLFMTPDTALGLGIGSDLALDLQIGEKQFQILDLFREDPDKSLTITDLAPKVYMGLGQLDSTGLVRFGSRVHHVYHFSFPGNRDVPGLTQALRSGFYTLSQGNPRVQVYDTRDANQQLGRLTRYVTGYLGMVGMVALFLAGMAAAFLFRGALARQQHQMAILMGIGARRWEVYAWAALQLVILGAAAALLALVFALALLPVFPGLFKGLVPQGLEPTIDLFTGLTALGLGVAGSLLFCLPVFVRLFQATPLNLLNGGLAGPDPKKGRMAHLLSFLPLLTVFFGLAAAAAGGVKDGLVFSLGFGLALALLALGGLGVLYTCRRLARTTGLWFPVRMALRSLHKNQWASLSCFVTIAAAVFLMALIPQIQKGLETEIMRPQGMKLPVFFLVDIQEDQVADLKSFMQGQKGELTHLSPVVPGRIISVNSQPFLEREDAGGSRPGQIRGRRLEFIFSFREALSESETLVAGSPLPAGAWDGKAPFGISVATTFAQRHGLALGDRITFDVQGIPLTGEVMNLRKVNWNSFQPNFFLLFQNGVLNEAPKTYLGTISNLGHQFRNPLKNSLMDRFPNVSVIDVTQTATAILGVADRLSLSIGFMAWLALGAGLVSIFSIARHQARQNRQQVNLLKVLGSGVVPLQAMSLTEFGILGFTAGALALGLSVLFSLGISVYFFDSLWALNLPGLLLILVLTTLLCLATGLAAARQVMKVNPLELLKA